MPIPRNWSEELITEWLCLRGYSTDVGVQVGRGSAGGRKEADVIGVKVSLDDTGKRILNIFHIEVGQLGGYDKSLEMIREKFSSIRTDEVIKRYKDRMAFEGNIVYRKLYVDIWERPSRVTKLKKSPELSSVGIEVWTVSELFRNVLTEITSWGEYTLPESYWMLKLLESLLEAGLITAHE
jgi:hypothetical protein